MNPTTQSQQPSVADKRQTERRLKEIASIFYLYKEFGDEVSRVSDGKYLKFLEGTLDSIISRTRPASDDKPGVTWEEARDQVLTLELLEIYSSLFKKSAKEILSHLGKVSSHRRWLKGIYRNNEESLLPRLPLPPVEVRKPVPYQGNAVLLPEAEPKLATARFAFLNVPDNGCGIQGAFGTRPDLLKRKRGSRRGNWRREFA